MASAPPPPILPPPRSESASILSVPTNNANPSNQATTASRSSVRGVGRGVGNSGRGGGGGRYNGNGNAVGGRGSHGGGGRGRNHPHNAQTNNGNPHPHPIRPVNEVPYGYLPAFLPGASSMVEQLDRKLLVILRDGRHLVGILRTFDQYSNMVLQETSERRILVVTSEESETTHQQRASDKIGNAISLPPSSKTICYQTDIELGLFIVRGDNVVLFGEVDDEEESIDGLVRFVSLEEFQQLEEEEEQRQANGGKGGSEPINWDFDTDLVA